MQPTALHFSADSWVSSLVAISATTAVVGVWVPATWTPAPIALELSLAEDEWAVLRAADGTPLTLNAIALPTTEPSILALETRLFAAGTSMRAISGERSTPINQAAALDLYVLWAER